MKVCTRCRQRKSLSSFSKKGDGTDSLRSACNQCRNAEADPVARREAVKKSREKHNEKYKPRRAEKSARRRAMKAKATPAWASADATAQYYLMACYLTQEFGVPFEVDHIVPLQSKEVCGLHCESNLTFMPAAWNKAKGNWTWPAKP